LSPPFEGVEALGFPMMVKPAREGSSLGISKVLSRHDLEEAYAKAAGLDARVLGERWVEGEEYTVALLKGKALPVIRLEPQAPFFDFEAKYRGKTLYHCPSGLSKEAEEGLQQLALEAFDILGASGWGRVDMLLDREGQPWLLEINTVPGMTEHSLVPMAARAAGMDFDALVRGILETSL
ncbi:MAG: ATP-grasp domain-containing protein, partial [Gammaproteobacteria bacterium]